MKKQQKQKATKQSQPRATRKEASKSQSIDFLKGHLLYDKILVRPLDIQASVMGLATSTQYDDKPEFGTVLMVGSGILLQDGTVVPLQYKPGDIVFFEKYSTKKVRVNGEDLLMLRADDIDWYERK